MFLSNRYQYLLLGLCFLKPRSIIEIGLAQGVRAYQMVQFALKYNSNVKYTGYDVFDTKNYQWHKLVGNGKKVSSKAEIKKQLNKLTTNIELIEGMTANTLWTKKNKADFVWLDGDHRLESIRQDYEALKESKVIVFDDYYTNEEHNGFHINEYGCNKIIEKFDKDEILISSKTKKFPNVRIVFWSKNVSLINELKNFLSDKEKIKSYLSL
tara:strand:+ start:868 stop:1500 length:633 start_codon:yes stop_codon:yes gene_type:complete